MDRRTDILMKIVGVSKYLLLILLLVFIINLLRGDKLSDADISDVADAVTSSVDMTGISAGDNRAVKRLYGINANDYEQVALYTSESTMAVEEILIVKLKDTSQAESVESAVDARVDSQLQSFEGYGPEQCSLLDAHVLDVQGNYILFVVHGEAQAADKAFQNSL